MKLSLCGFALSLLLLGFPGFEISSAEAAGAPTLEDLAELGAATTAPLMVGPNQVAQDVYALQPREVVVPRIRGVKRTLLGFILLAALFAHLYTQVYPQLMPVHHKAIHKAKQLKEKVLNEEQTSKLEYIAERYMKYAQEHPELAGGQAAALFFGLVFFLSGIVALSRPRRRRGLVKRMSWTAGRGGALRSC
ncbi:hypothetical protein Emag_001359 [Eimeria magna]